MTRSPMEQEQEGTPPPVETTEGRGPVDSRESNDREFTAIRNAEERSMDQVFKHYIDTMNDRRQALRYPENATAQEGEKSDLASLLEPARLPRLTIGEGRRRKAARAEAGQEVAYQSAPEGETKTLPKRRQERERPDAETPPGQRDRSDSRPEVGRTDAPGQVNEVSYPDGRKRSFQRDDSGQVTAITTKDQAGKQLSHYVKDGGKWFFETPEGMRARIEGDIQVSPKGDVSFESSPATWRTERVDGTTVTEKTNSDGSRVSLDKQGRAERVTRSDGSFVEVKRDGDKIISATETGADGKSVTWTRKGDKFESDPPSAEKRENIELSTNSNYSYESSDGFKYTTLGEGSKIVDDLGKTTQRDAKGRVESITYPGGKKTRTFGRDDEGNVTSITTRDEKGERTYVKDGNKWALEIDGMRLALPGQLQVSAKGDVSFETGKGQWRTEKTNGQVVQEKENENGSRIVQNKDGKIEKITRKDGSVVEAQYDKDGALSQISEYNKDGSEKVTWINKGDHWESYPASKEHRKNIELAPNGLLTYTGADGHKHVTLGDGQKIIEGPGKARYTFDKQGRFESITYADGDALKFSYTDSGELSKVERSKDGKLVQSYTRVGTTDGWRCSDGNGKDLGGWRGEFKVTPSGEFRHRESPELGRNKDGFWTVQKPDGSTFEEKVNSDGSRVIKTADKATVEIDKDGLVRKVSTSKDNYRTFDYENGELTKVTDFRKGKESGGWQRKPGDQEKSDVRVTELGEVTYRTKDGGAVIEKANQTKIELDKDGYLTRVTQANGSSRQFTYEAKDGGKQVKEITDRRPTERGESVETWTRKAGSETFVCSKDGRERVRTDIVVGRDGDYQYKNSDGKVQIAKAGRDTTEGGMSESVTDARDSFREAIDGQLDEARKARLEKMMTEFEKRMSSRVEAQIAGGKNAEKAQEEAEKAVAGTYDHLAQMVRDNQTGTFYDQNTRVKLAENFMFHAMDPANMDQGGHGTCWAQAGIISGGLIPHPDHMARLVKEISLTGSYTTLNGGENSNSGPKKYTFSNRLLTIRGEESRWTIDNAIGGGSRSPVGMIFDQVIPHMIRPEGQRSDGGWYDGNGGIRNMMYMVTGNIVEHRRVGGTQDVRDDKQTLLEKGGFITYNPGHMRSRHLRKEGDQWVIVQDDQHGEGNDRVIAVVDLKTWSKQSVNRQVQRLQLDKVGDRPTGEVSPGGTNRPQRPDQPSNQYDTNPGPSPMPWRPRPWRRIFR